jgi:hypothetical protein
MGHTTHTAQLMQKAARYNLAKTCGVIIIIIKLSHSINAISLSHSINANANVWRDVYTACPAQMRRGKHLPGATALTCTVKTVPA